MLWPFTASSTTGSPSQDTCAGSGKTGIGQGDGLVRRFEDEAGPQGPAVLAPGHQRDVEATLEQAGADGAPDGTGPTTTKRME